MNLLPDVFDGQLVMTKEEKKVYSNNFVSAERKQKFAEAMNKIKAKHLEKEIKKIDEVAGELNNLGRKEVTADFSDSPHLA